VEEYMHKFSAGCVDVVKVKGAEGWLAHKRKSVDWILLTKLINTGL
jgi:hypothetical protein